MACNIRAVSPLRLAQSSSEESQDELSHYLPFDFDVEQEVSDLEDEHLDIPNISSDRLNQTKKLSASAPSEPNFKTIEKTERSAQIVFGEHYAFPPPAIGVQSAKIPRRHDHLNNSQRDTMHNRSHQEVSVANVRKCQEKAVSGIPDQEIDLFAYLGGWN